MKRVILLLVDGLRPDLAEAELATGRLPNLARLTSGGTRTRAVTVFPSTTTVAYLPFLTGERPGRCNVPSIRWLDRAAYRGRWWTDRDAVRSYCGWQAGHVDRDMAAEVRTIFEEIPESIAIFSMITRGLTPERDRAQGSRKFWGTVSHYTKWYQPGDNRVAAELLAAVDEPWRFIFAQFPAVDGYTHCTDPMAPPVREALARVDATVGQLTERLVARGEADETLVLIVSDHGATSMADHFDVAQWLRAQGVRTLAHPVVWERQPRVAVMVAGNASVALYLHPGAPRAHRLPWDALARAETFGVETDILGALRRAPAVALMVAENGAGGLRVVAGEDSADLSESAGMIDYRPIEGDPLQVGGAFRGDPDAWLARSFDSPFPDAAVNLIDQFRSPRAGDLVIAAREGWDFRDRWELPEHKSGHGSLIAPHMLVPAWSNRPLPGGPLRTTDLHGLMTRWLATDR